MSEPVLVLSGSIGAGHDAVAGAVVSALESAGASAEVLDCMRLPGRLAGALGSAAFKALLRRPALYDSLHFSQLRAGSGFAERIERAGAASLVPPLAAELDRRSTRLAVAVFATGAGALGRLRKTRPDLRSAVVLTDATAHRLWAHEGIDRYVALSALSAATLRRYLPGAEVVVVPPPVRPGCYGAPTRDEARVAAGLEWSSGTVVLLTAGAWGRAALDELADGLLRRRCQVIAVAGSNRAVLERLTSLASSLPAPAARRLAVRGWTDELPLLMAASDVVVTAPGQSCHEARAVGRPLVLLDVVPGHGRENLLAELALGGALSAAPEPGAVAAAAEAAAAGMAGPAPAWPVADRRAWDARFLAALGDLRPS